MMPQVHAAVPVLGLLGMQAVVPLAQAVPAPPPPPSTTTGGARPIPTVMFLARVVAPDAPDFDGQIMGQYHPTWESSIADLWRPTADSSDIIDWDYVYMDDGSGSGSGGTGKEDATRRHGPSATEPMLVWNRMGSPYFGTLYRDRENEPLVVMDPATATDEDEERRIKGLYTDGYGAIVKLDDDGFTFTGE